MTKHIQVCREPGLARDTVGGCSKAGVNTENPGHQATSRGGPVHHLHPPPISRCRVLVCGAHSRSTRNCRHAAYVHTGACVYMQIQGGSWNITPVPQVHAQGCTPYKDVCAHIYGPVDTPHTHTHTPVHTQEDETSTQPPPLAGEWDTASPLAFCHLICKAVRIKCPSPQEALKTGSRAEGLLG